MLDRARDEAHMALLITASTRADLFAQEVRARDPGIDVRIAPALGHLTDIDYALVWNPPHGLLRTLPSLKLIISVGAGVDGILSDPELPENAIGFDEPLFLGWAAKSGLRLEAKYAGGWCGRERFASYQDILVFAKT